MLLSRVNTAIVECVFSVLCQAALAEDFRALRERLEAEGCFKTQPLFFILHLSHILLLEAIALMMVYYLGNGWINTAIVAVLLATAQVRLTHHYDGLQTVLKKQQGCVKYVLL